MENPATKIELVEATPTKTLTEVRTSQENKTFTNLSNMFCTDQDIVDVYPSSADEQENSSPKDQKKLFPLFHKENWNKSNNIISE